MTNQQILESKRSLVLLPYKCKPWAFLLDYSYQEIIKAVILDFSRIQSPRPTTRKRKKFQYNIIKEANFQDFNFGTWRSLAIALIDLPSDFKKFRESQSIKCKLSQVAIDDILHCRLAAFLGIRNFERKDTPFFEFLRHYLVTRRTAIELDTFLQKFHFSVDKIVVFNGREPLESTCIKIADKYGLPTKIIEKGSDNSRFQVFQNSPHFHPDWWKLINTEDTKRRLPKLSSQADVYLRNKLEGIDPYFGDKWMSNSDRNIGVDEFTDSNTVLFFTSSSTEFSPFDRFNYDVGYKSQYEAVKALANQCIRKGYKLIIRRHPNSIGIDHKDREKPFWDEVVSMFPKEEVKYIGPFEGFATYRNVERCRMVFVWKSSIGFETLALNKPTFALASAKWSWNRELQCWNEKEIEFALENSSELVSQFAPVIVSKYANFMSQSGTKCVTFTSAHKWGIILGNNSRIYNGIFEKYIQKIQARMPKFFGRRG